ncbi:MAG: hypothetical protein IJJ77_06695 [Paludibacteraceae bacterium]|nr:hypothetical protein [Paludibacteraceae bacterium]
MRNLLFYILSIFILFPHNGLAQKQGASQETKRFEVLRDSGSFNFAIEELIKDEKVIQKYFTNIDYIKRADRNTLLLKQKNAIKASLRICVDQGNLGPYQGKTSAIYEDTLYTKPINVISFHVEGIAKAERSVKVSIYDNFSNTCLAEKTYTLSPVIVHKYTPEIRYTDENGNSQVYTNETPCWIPASTTSPAYFIVRDEYGKKMENIWYELHHYDTMGSTITLPMRYKTDTIPVNMLITLNRPPYNPSKCLPKWFVISSYGEKRVEILEIRR